MLNTDNRQLFLEALKPPLGYRFDRGIGTTFTLDLIALLITPLSLMLFDRGNIDEALQDPLLLLEGLRSNANRLTIFCQAGYIAVPPKDNYLYRYLEDIVLEVKAPGGGVFHPKVWLLRYISENGPTVYRLLNLSRNLTFDRCWDLMLQIDGEVADRKVGYSRNRPLSDFVHSLSELALREPSTRIKDDIDLISEEVRKLDFLPPLGFEDYPIFYPSGIPGYRSYRFDDYISRLMVISPFLTRPFLNQITRKGENHILISMVDSIDEMSPAIHNRFEKIYVMDDLASSDPEDEDFISIDREKDDVSSLKEVELTGLHAKLFVMESGWDVKWLLGSGNATDAFYRGRNVEFMIELSGKKSLYGIDKILGEEDDDFALLTLLKPYPVPEKRIEIETAKLKAEELADDLRRWLVDQELYLEVQGKDDSQLDLALVNTTNIQIPAGDFSVTCWPVNLISSHAQTLTPALLRAPIVFPNISIKSITPFIAFQVEARVDNHKLTTRFVLNLPIENMPPTRDDLIISAIIENQGQFLRYLRLLLAGEGALLASDEWFRIGEHLSDDKSAWEDLDMPLLEDLVRALSRSPEKKIDRIAEIVEQLQHTEEGKQLIPKEFHYLWEIILQARNEIK